jgi:hypothetical protein
MNYKNIILGIVIIGLTALECMICSQNKILPAKRQIQSNFIINKTNQPARVIIDRYQTCFGDSRIGRVGAEVYTINPRSSKEVYIGPGGFRSCQAWSEISVELIDTKQNKPMKKQIKVESARDYEIVLPEIIRPLS